MPVNAKTISLIKKCRLKLIEMAQDGQRMSYPDIKAYLGLRPRANLRIYLNPIYDCEVRCFGRPDVTLILHFPNKKYGQFNSRGKAAGSIAVKPNDCQQLRTYGRDLREVYAFWGGHLHPDVMALLRS